MVLTAVAGHGVQKDETAVYLILVQGGSGPGNIIGYPDVDRICSTEFISEIIPKHTRKTPSVESSQANDNTPTPVSPTMASDSRMAKGGKESKRCGSGRCSSPSVKNP